MCFVSRSYHHPYALSHNCSDCCQPEVCPVPFAAPLPVFQFKGCRNAYACVCRTIYIIRSHTDKQTAKQMLPSVACLKPHYNLVHSPLFFIRTYIKSNDRAGHMSPCPGCWESNHKHRYYSYDSSREPPQQVLPLVRVLRGDMSHHLGERSEEHGRDDTHYPRVLTAEALFLPHVQHCDYQSCHEAEPSVCHEFDNFFLHNLLFLLN